jgi:L-ascorbate metabolism protein UlaG (beta-lactamase superfamily)
MTISSLTVPSGGLAIFWYGQNSFALKNAEGTVVMVDPYFPFDRPSDKFIHPEPPVDGRKIHADALLLTHDHGDHTCVESIGRLFQGNPAIKVLGPPESIERIEVEGISGDNLWPVVAGGAESAGSMNVAAVYSKLPETSPGCIHLGFVIDTGVGRVYVSGDPQNDFAGIPGLIDPLKALAPDIGLLTTHPNEGEFPFFEDTVEITRRVGLKVAIPAHYGCFVKRTYDPYQWAQTFPGPEPMRVIIPYAGVVMFSLESGWIGFPDSGD